ncbi:MAG: hypothetical protein RJA40_860 [Actinomycetota bacterium]
MSSAVVAILTLAIGLLIGLVLGFLIASRSTSTTGVSDAEFASVRAERDLYKSERDNAMAGSKLAGEIEAMKTAMEKLQKESADADRRRIEAESDIRTQVKAMSNHNESLVATNHLLRKQKRLLVRSHILKSAENLAKHNSS